MHISFGIVSEGIPEFVSVNLDDSILTRIWTFLCMQWPSSAVSMGCSSVNSYKDPQVPSFNHTRAS